MSDWMAIDPHLTTNRKFLRLKRVLGCSEDAALAGLFRFWSTAFDHAQDGDLMGWEDEELDGYFGTTGAAAALRLAGFIDEESQVHDWFDFGGRLYRDRRAGAERKARGRIADRKAKSQRHPSDVPGKSAKEERRVEESREEETLNPLSDDESPDALEMPLETEVVDEFQNFWTAYPRKETKAKAESLWNHLRNGERERVLVAVGHYREWCDDNPEAPTMLATTFLSTTGRRWTEWEKGPPDGRDRKRTGNAADRAFDALSEAYEEAP